jgi:outer membrane receptor protein involved in Fe transport
VTPLADPGSCVPGTSTFEAEELIVKALIEDQVHDECWDKHVGVRVDVSYIDDDRVGKDDLSVTFGMAAGVARHLTDCLTLYANGAFGFRRPSLSELYSIAVLDGITVFGNPDLGDEFFWNVEAGFKSSEFNRATLSAAVFAHGIDDFVGRRAVGTDEVWDNLGDVVLYGAEVAGSRRPNPCCCEGLEFFGTAGITFSSDEDIVPDVPIHGRAGVRWSNAYGPGCGLRRWFVEGAVRASDDSSHKVYGGDAFWTTEVLVGVGWAKDPRRNLRVQVGVTNLFDESYVEPTARLESPGRSLIASFSIDL